MHDTCIIPVNKYGRMGGVLVQLDFLLYFFAPLEVNTSKYLEPLIALNELPSLQVRCIDSKPWLLAISTPYQLKFILSIRLYSTSSLVLLFDLLIDTRAEVTCIPMSTKT